VACWWRLPSVRLLAKTFFFLQTWETNLRKQLQTNPEGRRYRLERGGRARWHGVACFSPRRLALGSSHRGQKCCPRSRRPAVTFEGVSSTGRYSVTARLAKHPTSCPCSQPVETFRTSLITPCSLSKASRCGYVVAPPAARPGSSESHVLRDVARISGRVELIRALQGESCTRDISPTNIRLTFTTPRPSRTLASQKATGRFRVAVNGALRRRRNGE